jgi:hypothetical protein
MNTGYYVTVEYSDGHGNVSYDCRDFPKTREGLNDAYAYAHSSGGLWEIHSMTTVTELVDSIGDAMERYYNQK